MKDPDRFLIKPGAALALEKLPTRDNTGLPSRAARIAQTAVLAQEIGKLQQLLYASQRHRLLVVLQGMDTSGKDGTIRSVFTGTSPLGIRTVNFKVPSEDELARDYLWRVHAQVPRTGEIVLFNRGHYEDVLVVRVEGRIDHEECHRRYHHLREFERLLVETGTTVLKIFLHISKEEQRERLQARLDAPDKRWKLRPSDLESRRRWPDYMSAYAQALGETSTPFAPWYAIPSDSKTARNLRVARLIRDTLAGLSMDYPDAPTDWAGQVIP